MSDQLKAILDAVPASTRIKAITWDMFYQNQSPDELRGALDALPLPSETKARVLQLKMGDQPSAAGRYASNAWEVLNPVAAVKGLYNAVRHPIDTGKNVVATHAAQFDKAKQRLGEGRYWEAGGHGMATVIPLVGPIAAEAGEQGAHGDVAGMLGTATGLVAPIAATGVVRGAARAARAVPESARARVADALESGASERVADVMSPKVGPNKTRIGNEAADVAPRVAKDMATNGAPLTRDGLHAQVGERLTMAEQGLDAASDARLAARTFETKPLIDALLEKRRDLTAHAVEGSHRLRSAGPGGVLDRVPLGQDVVPGPNASRVAVIDKAIDELRQLGPVTRYEPIRRIRMAYDGPAKAVYSPAMGPDWLNAKTAGRGAADVTGVLREQLAKWDPETAAANADYHVYRTANDALEAVREVERTRPRVGRAIMARLTATVAGQQAAGLPGAAVGYVFGPVLDSALSAGLTTKLKTANLMTKLANAIRRGDVESVDGLTKQLQRVRTGTAVQGAHERSQRRDIQMQAPGGTLTVEGLR